jgi:hypothetical protein
MIIKYKIIGWDKDGSQWVVRAKKNGIAVFISFIDEFPTYFSKALHAAFKNDFIFSDTHSVTIADELYELNFNERK